MDILSRPASVSWSIARRDAKPTPVPILLTTRFEERESTAIRISNTSWTYPYQSQQTAASPLRRVGRRRPVRRPDGRRTVIKSSEAHQPQSPPEPGAHDRSRCRATSASFTAFITSTYRSTHMPTHICSERSRREPPLLFAAHLAKHFSVILVIKSRCACACTSLRSCCSAAACCSAADMVQRVRRGLSVKWTITARVEAVQAFVQVWMRVADEVPSAQRAPYSSKADRNHRLTRLVCLRR